MDPQDLIRMARELAELSSANELTETRQAYTCRAVSTAYYALFHTLANSCADTLAGSNRAHPSWRQAYRSLEHGLAKRQCAKVPDMTEFGPEVVRFAGKFVVVQELRHTADYDPAATFARPQVLTLIGEIESTIAGFDSVGQDERRAFAIHVLFRSRESRTQPNPATQ